MLHRKIDQVESAIVREPGAKQISIKRLIDSPDGADRFVMSLFQIAPGGSSPPHYHDWEHEIYVVSGEAYLVLPGEDRQELMTPGSVVFIPRNEPHAFQTTDDQSCEFLVIAPSERPPIHSYFLSDEPWEHYAQQS